MFSIKRKSLAVKNLNEIELDDDLNNQANELTKEVLLKSLNYFLTFNVESDQSKKLIFLKIKKLARTISNFWGG